MSSQFRSQRTHPSQALRILVRAGPDGDEEGGQEPEPVPYGVAAELASALSAARSVFSAVRLALKHMPPLKPRPDDGYEVSMIRERLLELRNFVGNAPQAWEVVLTTREISELSRKRPLPPRKKRT